MRQVSSSECRFAGAIRSAERIESWGRHSPDDAATSTPRSRALVNLASSPSGGQGQARGKSKKRASSASPIDGSSDPQTDRPFTSTIRPTTPTGRPTTPTDRRTIKTTHPTPSTGCPPLCRLIHRPRRIVHPLERIIQPSQRVALHYIGLLSAKNSASPRTSALPNHLLSR